jgi:hypothetical protein
VVSRSVTVAANSLRAWLSVGQVGADVADAGDAAACGLDLGGSLGGFDVAVQDRDALLDQSH